MRGIAGGGQKPSLRSQDSFDSRVLISSTLWTLGSFSCLCHSSWQQSTRIIYSHHTSGFFQGVNRLQSWHGINSGRDELPGKTIKPAPPKHSKEKPTSEPTRGQDDVKFNGCLAHSVAKPGLGNLMRACFKIRRTKKGVPVNLVQKPMARKVLGKPVVLLHKYGVKVPSTYLHIYPESFFLQWAPVKSIN